MSNMYRFDQMKTMGVTNAGWGVCGFTSSLYAMYHLNPGARGKLMDRPDQHGRARSCAPTRPSAPADLAATAP